MAHDEKLNQRIRDILKGKRGITEQNMFGDLCFMHYGNMMCGADLKHGLSVRVGPEKHEDILKLKHTRPMDITGKPMKGLVFIDPEGYKTKAALAKWIERGMSFTKTLPKK
ncbi:MAG: TfoX/Sxy family protein [Pseudobacteriovorax sp.]|nr:TfoX/Sxy family protein [Pseudobacteriovorax sp.]